MAGVMGEGCSHLSFCSGGTPLYIAPEVVQHAHMSPAADIFSLGVLFWQLLHNRTPERSSGVDWFALSPIHSGIAVAKLRTKDLNSGGSFNPALHPPDQQPFSGSMQQGREPQRAGSVLMFPEFAPHIPVSVAELCHRCLALDPRSRPDVHTILSELHSLCVANSIPTGEVP
mmetsp:Transcript_10845/g.18818  ORF Transcript_10845/g.18818 Transcript_10845/m.18818 type:complete len:172 (+) Transcript_10845:1-516(+)